MHQIFMIMDMTSFVRLLIPQCLTALYYEHMARYRHVKYATKHKQSDTKFRRQTAITTLSRHAEGTGTELVNWTARTGDVKPEEIFEVGIRYIVCCDGYLIFISNQMLFHER